MRYTVDKNIWQKKVLLANENSESEVYHMKTRKIRLLSAFLALAMLLALLPTAAFAEDNIVASGTCGAEGEGNNLTWKLDSDGTLTISGTGAMADYGSISNRSPWSVNVPRTIQAVVIGKNVTSIGSGAFYNTTYLTNVTFGEDSNLTNIGVGAFGLCRKLTSITIPSSVTTIGANAFTGCEELTSITIPSSVTTIGKGAFEGCSKLKKVTFAPDSKLETIENEAFEDCHKDLIICYSDEGGKQALTKAGVKADKIKPANPTVTFDSKGGSDVAAKPVKNGDAISAPAAPTKDGYIFAGWYTDEMLNEKYDFNKSVIDNMTLYAKWTPGGTCGVGGKLTWTLDGGTLTISGSGAMTEYIGPGEQPWANQRSSINKVVIGGGVTSIGKQAFADCTQLSTVELPPNGALETININAFGRLDSSSEVGAGITEITIPESVKTIEMCAFNGCTKLATVTFAPNSQLEAIHSWAFQDTAISEISIPASVKIINEYVFKDCSNLTKVIFESPSKLDNVDENAFRSCSATIYYSDETVKNVLSKVVSPDRIKPANPTVTFEVDGKVYKKQNAKENNFKAVRPETPTKKGYQFTGWYTKDDNDKYELFDFGTHITDNITLYAQWEEVPVDTYVVTVENGVAWVEADAETEAVAAGESICVPEGVTVHVKADETAFDGMAFDRWEVRKGEVKLADDRAAETTFTMPAGEVQLEAMYQAADANDSGWDAATVVTGAVIGTGTAILAYHIGMEVYAEQVLGKDVAVPRTRGEVALLAWQLAGSPAVNVEGEPLSEAAQAERWAVESGLMQPDAEGNFNGTKKMSKWNALRTLEKAKQ